MIWKKQNLQNQLLIVLFGLLFICGDVWAVNPDSSGSKATLQQLEEETAERIQADQMLQTNIDNISLTPGPVGPQGPQGDVGATGSTGPAGSDGLDAPDRSDDLCALYQQLSATSLLGSLSVPDYCEPGNEVTISQTIFVTSETYSGNLGGLSGADSRCMISAMGAGLTGTYKAWLSDGVTSAGDRLVHSENPYVLVDGTVVAANWADLVDGELAVPILRTETGDFVDISSGQFVYTNTKYDASLMQTAAFWTCANWTDDGSGDLIFGKAGNVGAVDNNWTDAYVSSCNLMNHLYCVEQ